MNNISAADPDAGAGAAEVACVRADISLKTGLRLAVAVRRNKRAAAIAICSRTNKIDYSQITPVKVNERKSMVVVFFSYKKKKEMDNRKGERSI